MLKLALPLAIVAALGASSAMAATTPAKPAPMKPAVAAPTVTDGIIKTINLKAETVTLDNKVVYYFAKKFDLSKVKVGEKVAITWTAKGKKDMATAIAAVTA
jgi:hypothetical protein